MSIQTAPSRSAWNAPPGPSITASTCGGPGQHRDQDVDHRREPGALSATRAPAVDERLEGLAADVERGELEARRGARCAAIGCAHPPEADEPDDRPLAARRPATRSREVHPGGLELRVAVERVEALVAPGARLLEPAERDRHVRRVEGVDPHDAGAQPAREPVRQAHVRRPDRGRQPVVGVVGEPTASSGSSNSRTASTGPKISSRATRMSFVTPSRIVGREVGAAGLGEDPVAARHDAGALAPAEVDVAEHGLEMVGADERPEPRRRVERVAGARRSAKATSRSRNASLIERWTRTREPALHVWPAL